MPESRRQRRHSDPGAQPERTSLAWFRTLLSCCVFMLVIFRDNLKKPDPGIWLIPGVMCIIATLVYLYAKKRNLMDITVTDFDHSRSVTAKLIITLALFGLAASLVIRHIHHLVLLLT